MGQPALHHSAFQNLKFTKTGAQIKQAAEKVQKNLTDKVKERHARVEAVIKTKGLTMSQLLLAMRDVAFYAATSVANGPASGEGEENARSILTAGEKQQIQQELGLIQREEAEADKMRLIVANLNPDVSFELSFEDLEYLGF